MKSSAKFNIKNTSISILLFFILSFSGHAQNISTSESNHELADTIKPVPNKLNVYRASKTIVNDILHSKIEVAFDWAKSQLNATASILVKPYFYPTSTLNLNAKSMTVKKVEVYTVKTGLDNKQTPANKVQSGSRDKVMSSSFVYENDSIKINLGKVFTADQSYLVVIDYVAKPNEIKEGGGSAAISEDKGLYFINPKGDNPFKMPQIWTQGETEASSAWFPTIDSPNEKMTQEILMTVDQKYNTLSNGLLVSSTPIAGGRRIDHWKLDQPHSPYLAMMAVGEFKKVTDAPWNGKEISYYVEKEYEPHAKAIFGDTKEMIDFYSKKLGVPYPWSKYSQIVVRDYVSGAMENTSATLHGDFMVYQTTRETLDGKKGNSVIAHELFHQWFGDLVTAESWSNLPLNESFATYGEYLWEEYKFGREAADYRHWQSKMGYTSSDKEVDLIRFHYKDKEDMFDRFSYNKGGQVLHMLRKAVGDEAFFASLKNYLTTNKYKAAEIHHLRLAFEETIGQDMNWFFNQWFLNKGRPKLKVNKYYNPKTSLLELTIEQVQDLNACPLYVLPLEVDIYQNGKASRHHIIIKEQKQSFTFPVSAEQQFVNFDAERQLLADIDFPKTKEEYMLQYQSCPLYEDRLEALKNLEAKVSEADVYALFRQVAQNDKFYALRNFAITRLEKAPEEKNQDLKALYSNIYKSDQKNVTRCRALAALNRKFAGDSAVMALNGKALGEPSYAICAEGLESIAKSSPSLAMQKAKTLESDCGGSLLFVIANIYAKQGSDDEIPFFHSSIKKVDGFEIITLCDAYGKCAKRCQKSESVLLAANDLFVLSINGNKYSKPATTKALKELLTQWTEKENNLQKSLEVSKSSDTEFARIDKELAQATQIREKLAVMVERIK